MSRRRIRARFTIAALATFAIVVVFTFRLVDIQVVQAAQLNQQSYDSRSIEVTTYGTRGEVVDENGTVLASSVDRYNITVAPKVILGTHGVDSTLMKNLDDIAAKTGQNVQDLVAAVTKDPGSNFAYLAKGVDTSVFRAVRDLRIAGVAFEYAPARVYPQGATAGNLVGFMGTDGPLAGVEQMENTCLAGTNGTESYERSQDGVQLPGSTVTQKAAQNGGTVKLTIDADLQWFVQQALGEQVQAVQGSWGTAMVVRVKDGHIMAAADYPSVDPNDVNGAPRDASGNLILGSRAFTNSYEPGSVFKPMAMAALIDQGKATPTTQTIAPGWFTTPGGERFTDAWAHDDIRYTLAGVLVNSSNTGVSSLVERVSDQTRYQYMQKFGIGTTTAVHFPGEDKGILRPASQWDDLSRYEIGFGQGVTATSAQVAGIYQTFGNGGVRMPLTLVEGCEHPDGIVTDVPSTQGTRVVAQKTANEMVNILEETVTQGSLKSTVHIPGYRVAAKTGTAQVALPNGQGYGPDHIVSVAGVAPADDPQYAVVVTIGMPHTITTSAAAAPAFSKVMSQTLTTFRVPPSTKPAPYIPLTW